MSDFTVLKVLGSLPSPGPITRECSLGNQAVIDEHTSDSGSLVDLCNLASRLMTMVTITDIESLRTVGGER